MSRDILINSFGLFEDSDVIPANLISVEWLLTSPEVLLWANRIVMSERTFIALAEGFFRGDNLNQTALTSILDRLKAEGVVKIVSPEKYLPEITRKSVSEFVDNDFRENVDTPAVSKEDGKWEPGLRKAGEISMCPRALESLFLNLKASQFLGCTCFLDSRERLFLNQRYPKTSNSFSSGGQMVFADLYDIALPHIDPHKEYGLFCPSDLSNTCANQSKCTLDMSKRATKLCDYLMFAREKPEINRLANYLDTLEQAVGNDPDVIYDSLQKDITREQKRIRELYPTIKRWGRLMQGISVIGLATYGIDRLPEGLAGVIPALFGSSLEFAVDKLETNNSWKLALADNLYK